MKRIAFIGVILAVFLAADGIYMVVSKYNGGETQAWNLPDGWIVLISAIVLLLASLLGLVLPSLSSRAEAPQATGGSSEVEPEQA